MAIHAQAIEILVTKGRFEPQVALGIAEAIELSVRSEQFVTVPILDSRLQGLKAENQVALNELDVKMTGSIVKLGAELRTELHAVKAELVRWVFLTMLGNVALGLGVSAISKLIGNLQ